MKNTIPQKIPVLFSRPKKISASFIDPKKSLLAEMSDPKKSFGPPSLKYVSGAPGPLTAHVTNTSFKQRLGILLMTKIDRGYKNYLTPEI